MMQDRIQTFLDEYGAALTESARLASEKERLDEECRIVFSDIVATTEGSIAKAEHIARSHARYREATTQLARVREDAAVAKARCVHMQARLDVWRTRAATQRTLKQIGES